MARISSLGVGSGLDLNTTLDKFEKAAKDALKPISKQQSAATAKLSAYGTLKTALQKFQTASENLSSADSFQKNTTLVSSSDVSAESTPQAGKGSYTISVEQLARSQKLTSDVVSDTHSAIGSGDSDAKLTFTNKKGEEKSIFIKASKTSLSDIKDAINSSNSSVTASIIKVSSTGYRLALKTLETGVDAGLEKINVTGDVKLGELLSYEDGHGGGMTQNSSAMNAKVKVDGVSIESSSNTLKEGIEGVTLKLNKATISEQTITISSDEGATKKAISDWVESFNTLQDTMASLDKYTPTGAGKDPDENNGPLVGDGAMRTIQNQIKEILVNNSGSGNYRSISQIGITTSPSDGKLKLDETKLGYIVSTNSAGLEKLFVGDEKKIGVATGLLKNIKEDLDSRGILQSANETISKKLNSLTDKYNKAMEKIDKDIDRYKIQFARLDKLVSSLNKTSDYLNKNFETTSKK